MPLQTFKNLSKEKQQAILDAAYEEFALNNYNTASVSTIVKNLGIAKGSFYRYFKNKIDLYSYLVQHAYELRMQQLDKLLIDPSYSFFDILRENFRNKIKFDTEYPLPSIFMYKIMFESEAEVLEIVDKLKKTVIELTKSLIINYQQSGQINKEIDPGKIAFLIFQVQVGIYDYLSLYKGINYLENIRNKKTVFALPEEEIMEIVEDFANIIKIGLSIN